jgi:hypothetical protein
MHSSRTEEVRLDNGFIPGCNIFNVFRCLFIRPQYSQCSQCSNDTTGWTTVVRFRAGAGILLCATTSRSALGPTQPPIQWVPAALFLGVKRPERETDHSPLSSAEVKHAWSYTSTSPHAFMAWCLVKK